MIEPFAILSLIIAIPFFGMLFVLTAKESSDGKTRNSFNTAIFTIVVNMVMIWRVFMIIDEKTINLQLFEKFNWLSVPEINLIFAVDTLSLLMILALHLIILIGTIFAYPQTERQKSFMIFTLFLLGLTTGLFVSADIFSFFIFFEALLLPLFMLIGMFGNLKRPEKLNGFFIYNLIGSFIMFAGILLIYHHYGSMTLEQSHKILWDKNHGWYIWGFLAIGLISRIPIWPFHYWISSITSKIHNPLVFISAAILPLSGIYGLIRFWPRYIPTEITDHFIWINIIGTITMLFIALIGFTNRDSQYKVFSFITVYYILYLLGIFSRDKLVTDNLKYALFGFLIVFAALEALSSYIYNQEQQYLTTSTGFLCRTKRLSLLYSFITMAAAGLPVSAMFANNFLILSQFLKTNIHMATFLILALIISAGTLISEMFRLKTENKECQLSKHHDISGAPFVFMLFIVFILLMSFIRPLWFVVNE